jgi:hypothetical protein
MIEEPRLETARLLLRAWTMDDVPALQRLAGRRENADTMISIPPAGRSRHVRRGRSGLTVNRSLTNEARWPCWLAYAREVRIEFSGAVDPESR